MKTIPSTLRKLLFFLAIVTPLQLFAAPGLAEAARSCPALSSSMSADAMDWMAVNSSPAPALAGIQTTPPPVQKASCYFRHLGRCGSCVFWTECLIYGWNNRFGRECWGRDVEYCDGVPSGREYPYDRIECGC